jgi:LPS O-antigen subunit length determinant protein (WzzB/FepE family)
MTVENKVATSTATTAYGKKLDAPINYEYKWSTYANIDELRTAKDELTDEEQVKVRNTERQNNARQKALQAALDAAGIVKPTIENDEQLRLRDMFKVLMSSKKYTEEQARDLASTTLGIEWATE